MFSQSKVSEDGNYEEIDLMYCGAYKNYALAYRFDTGGYPLLNLIDSETSEMIPLLSNDIYISEQCIYKDTLYYRYFVGIEEANDNIGNICSLNLLTGEKKAYNIENTLGHTHELSYNFANDRLYLLSESSMAVIDLNTDKITRQNIQSHEHDEESHSHSMYNLLYSDGETIYIIDDSDSKEQLITIDDFIAKMSVS